MKNLDAFLLGVLVLLAFWVFALEPVKASGDFWVERAPMPSAATYVGAVTANGEIYAVTPTATYLYNPSTNTWETKVPMPTKEYAFAIATYQNMIYVIGGCSGFDSYGYPVNCTGINQVYNIATNSWEIKAPMPTARAYLQANVVDGKIYLIGGWSKNYVPAGNYPNVSNANEVYDPTNDSWTTMASNPLGGAYGYASAVIDGKIYMISGQYSLDVYPPNVNMWYNPQTNTWSWPNNAATNPNNGGDNFIGAGAAATTGALAPARIYFIGDSFNLFYNPETNGWTSGAAMPTPRLGMGVVNVNDTIYAIGGSINTQKSNFTTPTAVNEEYFPSGYKEQTSTVPEFSSFVAVAALIFATLILVITIKKKRRKIILIL